MNSKPRASAAEISGQQFPGYHLLDFVALKGVGEVYIKVSLEQGALFETRPVFTCKLVALYQSAPGRIRTCDRRIRSPLLCPLSYGRIRLLYCGILASGVEPKTPVAAMWQQ